MINQIGAAEYDDQPFPHLIVRRLLPAHFYEELCRSFPDKEHHAGFSHQDQIVDGQSTRFVFYVDRKEDFERLSSEQQKVWASFYRAMDSVLVKRCIFHRLQQECPEALEQLHTQMQAVYDTASYKITPHCDVGPGAGLGSDFGSEAETTNNPTNKYLSRLTYCPPPDADKGIGTELYVPDANGNIDGRGGVYDQMDPNYPKHFRLVKRAPYEGNALCLLCRSTAFPGTVSLR